MTVYVDDMKASVGRMIMCHMIADTEAELHAMADKIGVARKWHQGDHYDICKSMRRKAVKAGASEVTVLQAALMRKTWKRTGVMPAADDAFEVWKAMCPSGRGGQTGSNKAINRVLGAPSERRIMD